MADAVDFNTLQSFVDQAWEKDAIPSLTEYVRMPCISHNYDPDWVANGQIHAALKHMKAWADSKDLKGYHSEIIDRKDGDAQIPPLLLITIDATNGSEDTALLYGHCDKQPPLTDQWTVAGPFDPQIIDDKLYGRGSCDDGYAIYAAMLAVKAIQDQNIPHGKIVIFIESEEESGSAYLNYYLDVLSDEKNLHPSFVAILDSGGNDHNHLWSVSSLRGIIDGVLRVEVAAGSVHSGAAGNCLPSPFRIARSLLSRIEDENTGRLKLKELQADIPDRRREESLTIAKLLGDSVWTGYNFLPGVTPLADGSRPTVEQIAEINLGISWHSSLAVVGISHSTVPDVAKAGNTISPYTELKVSIRLAPGLDPGLALDAVERELTRDPPYGAKVTFSNGQKAPSFRAPIPQPWLDAALDHAAEKFYGTKPLANGRGGSIPFIAEFTAKFPGCDIMVTGAVGPDSFMHGPNENLHIPSAKKITGVLACLIAAHGAKK